ncbi:MAG: hypothetical protein AB1489_32000, partial [Acidobacteriota bacterium]
MKRFAIALLILMFLYCSLTQLASMAMVVSDAKLEKSKWVVDDLIMVEKANDFQISPDCRWVVWVKNTPDKDKGEYIANLMLSSLTEKKDIELTRSNDENEQPKWSMDGQMIAFTSTRKIPKTKSDSGGEEGKDDDESKPQLWLMHPFGGEPWALTDLKRGVKQHEWVDAETIIFSAQEDHSNYESNIKEKKDTSIVVDDEPHAPPVRLFQVSVKTKKIKRLTDNTDRIQLFAVSPDGNYVVAVHERSLRFVYDNRVKPAVFLHNLKTGETRAIFTETKFNITEVRWTKDSKGFYAINAFTTHPQYVHATINQLYYFDLAAGISTQIELDWENGISSDLAITDNGFVTLLANGARNVTAHYRRDGSNWRKEVLTGEQARNIFAMKVGKDNRTIVYNYSTASLPSQWYRAQIVDGRIDTPTQITDINQHFKKRTIAKTEVIRWKGALDEEVEGILYYPHNYQSGKKYPLVVMIHGGPAGADFDSWDDTWFYPQNFFNEREAFVL